MNNEQKERRERIATEVLAGYIHSGHSYDYTIKELAQDAVRQADALIKALDSEPKTGVRDPLADYVEIDVDSVQNGGDNGEA